MNKILKSLLVLGVVAVLAVGATRAYFSDTEESVGNTFQAGSLDLKVDSTCHYDGMVCAVPAGVTSGETVWVQEDEGSSTYPELLGTPCSCTWLSKDLDGDLFFNFRDVKPGDVGENTISLTAVDNDAYLCAYVQNLKDSENDCTEPEGLVDGTCSNPGAGLGELEDYVHLKIWADTGVGEQGKCDNEWQAGEVVLVEDTTINSNNGVWDLNQLVGNETTCLGVAWSIPAETGNVIQTDSVTGDVAFYIEQVRNNPDFVCPRTYPSEVKPTRILSSVMQYGPNGWGGWSCPVGTHVVGGGYLPGTASVQISEAAQPGSVSGLYPVYPHYTFPGGETGWVVQNDNDGESIQIYVDCLPN